MDCTPQASAFFLMIELLPSTLLGVARKHWRSFLPAWLFPFVFLYGGRISEHIEHPLLFLWVIALPLFFWSSIRASNPWINKEIGYWYFVFWGMLVPFALWVLAVFSRLLYSA
jgi:hypothetical protein